MTYIYKLNIFIFIQFIFLRLLGFSITYFNFKIFVCHCFIFVKYIFTVFTFSNRNTITYFNIFELADLSSTPKTSSNFILFVPLICLLNNFFHYKQYINRIFLFYNIIVFVFSKTILLFFCGSTICSNEHVPDFTSSISKSFFTFIKLVSPSISLLITGPYFPII